MRIIAFLMTISLLSQQLAPLAQADAFSNYANLPADQRENIDYLTKQCSNPDAVHLQTLTSHQRQYVKDPDKKNKAYIYLSYKVEGSDQVQTFNCEGVGIGPVKAPKTSDGGSCSVSVLGKNFNAITEKAAELHYDAQIKSCEKTGTSLMSGACLSEVGCDLARSVLSLGGPVGWLVEKAASSINATAASCLNPKKGSCIASLVEGFLKDLWGMVEGVWGAVKWAGRAIKDAAVWCKDRVVDIFHFFTDSQAETEAKVTKKLMAMSKSTRSQISRFLSDPWGFVQDSIKSLLNSAMDTVSGMFKGAKLAFKCASCTELLDGGCKILGMLGGEVLVAFLTGGAVNMAAKAAEAGKLSKIGELINGMTKAVKGAAKFTAESWVGRGASKVLQLGKPLATGLGKIPGIKQFMNISEQAYMRGYLGKEAYVHWAAEEHLVEALGAVKKARGQALSIEEKTAVAEHPEVNWKKLKGKELDTELLKQQNQVLSSEDELKKIENLSRTDPAKAKKLSDELVLQEKNAQKTKLSVLERSGDVSPEQLAKLKDLSEQRIASLKGAAVTKPEGGFKMGSHPVGGNEIISKTGLSENVVALEKNLNLDLGELNRHSVLEHPEVNWKKVVSKDQFNSIGQTLNDLEGSPLMAEYKKGLTSLSEKGEFSTADLKALRDRYVPGETPASKLKLVFEEPKAINKLEPTIEVNPIAVKVDPVPAVRVEPSRPLSIKEREVLGKELVGTTQREIQIEEKLKALNQPKLKLAEDAAIKQTEEFAKNNKLSDEWLKEAKIRAAKHARAEEVALQKELEETRSKQKLLEKQYHDSAPTIQQELASEKREYERYVESNPDYLKHYEKTKWEKQRNELLLKDFKPGETSKYINGSGLVYKDQLVHDLEATTRDFKYAESTKNNVEMFKSKLSNMEKLPVAVIEKPTVALVEKPVLIEKPQIVEKTPPSVAEPIKPIALNSGNPTVEVNLRGTTHEATALGNGNTKVDKFAKSVKEKLGTNVVSSKNANLANDAEFNPFATIKNGDLTQNGSVILLDSKSVKSGEVSSLGTHETRHAKNHFDMQNGVVSPVMPQVVSTDVIQGNKVISEANRIPGSVHNSSYSGATNFDEVQTYSAQMIQDVRVKKGSEAFGLFKDKPLGGTVPTRNLVDMNKLDGHISNLKNFVETTTTTSDAAISVLKKAGQDVDVFKSGSEVAYHKMGKGSSAGYLEINVDGKYHVFTPVDVKSVEPLMQQLAAVKNNPLLKAQLEKQISEHLYQSALTNLEKSHQMSLDLNTSINKLKATRNDLGYGMNLDQYKKLTNELAAPSNIIRKYTGVEQQLEKKMVSPRVTETHIEGVDFSRNQSGNHWIEERNSVVGSGQNQVDQLSDQMSQKFKASFQARKAGNEAEADRLFAEGDLAEAKWKAAQQKQKILDLTYEQKIKEIDPNAYQQWKEQALAKSENEHAIQKITEHLESRERNVAQFQRKADVLQDKIRDVYHLNYNVNYNRLDRAAKAEVDEIQKEIARVKSDLKDYVATNNDYLMRTSQKVDPATLDPAAKIALNDVNRTIRQNLEKQLIENERVLAQYQQNYDKAGKAYEDAYAKGATRDNDPALRSPENLQVKYGGLLKPQKEIVNRLKAELAQVPDPLP